jgi:hypothetical protein
MKVKKYLEFDDGYIVSVPWDNSDGKSMREICADIIRYLINEGCEIVYGVTNIQIVFEYSHKLFLEKPEIFKITDIEDIDNFEITKLIIKDTILDEYLMKCI